jgi:4-amino-4-deoxy-L-arabinose transferase-like glycosyltransferase
MWLKRLAEFLYTSRWASFFVIAVFGSGLKNHDLRQDGLLYAAVSKTVLTTSDPLILHAGEKLYLNKPPLFYWINAFFIKMFGAEPFAAKMGGFISIVLLALLIYYVAELVYEKKNVSILSVFILCTTYTVYQNTFTNRMEGMLSLFMILSVLFFAFFAEKEKRINLYLSAFFAGLAVMTKGPLGVVPVISFGLYLIIFDRKLFKRQFAHLFAACLLFVGVFIWWYAYISLRTDFIDVFFRQQLIERMAGEGDFSGSRSTPIYEYFRFMVQRYFMYLPFLLYGIYKSVGILKENTFARVFGFTAVVHLVLMHFISTRDDRYLYQFYVVASIFAAYGLWSVFRLNYEKIVTGVAAVYAVFLVTWSGQLNWDSYKCLIDANKMAKISGMPLVAEKTMSDDIGYNAGITFFLDSYRKTPPAEGEYIYLAPAGYRLKEGERRLKKSQRVSLVLRTASSSPFPALRFAPAPVKPPTWGITLDSMSSATPLQKQEKKDNSSD